jgi:parallel beta helix pectate lyase-like protein
MRRKHMTPQWSSKVALILAVLLMSVGWSLYGQARSGLLIQGDSGLASFEGIVGDGSAEEPYVIDGLNFDAAGDGICLEIRDTQAHLILRECRFSEATAAALLLTGSKNVWVIACVFENNTTGVFLSPTTRQVTLTLNTFRDNEQDIVAHPNSAILNDGVAGNWWGIHAGKDENGDGITEQSYEIRLRSGVLVDQFPLAYPYVDEQELQPDTFRLELEYSLGQRIEWINTSTTTVTVIVDEKSSQGIAKINLVCLDVVISAPGTGIFELGQEGLSETGEKSLDGESYPYEATGIEGAYYRTNLHRFGAIMDTSSNSASTGGAAYMPYPVRPISVGHEWTRVWMIASEELGLPNSEANCVGSYRFERLDERDGRVCAVIVSHVDIDVRGVIDNDTATSVEFATTVKIDSLSFIDLASGRIVEQSREMSFSTVLTAYGAPEIRVETLITDVLQDVAPDDAT